MILVDKINRSGNLANKLCWEGNDVNKAYRSGELIYQRVYEDRTSKSDYLTFNIVSSGEIKWIYDDVPVIRTISYSLNDGEWVEITSSEEATAPSIRVSSGDIIKFKGLNSNYCDNDESQAMFESDCRFEVCGNIMSLIYGDNFEDKTVLPSGHSFCWMFSRCHNITSIENLFLPATTLTSCCYYYMFNGCTGITTATELPAATLADRCYSGMFSNCTSLNYVKCLATDISAFGCTTYWLGNVSPTGTFVKNPDMSSWAAGGSGIPNNWTVINAT